MKFFLTGSTGFIGSNLLNMLRAIIKKNDTIYLLQRAPKEYSSKNIIPILGSLESIKKHERIISLCDYIFHLAAEATFGNDLDYLSVNYQPVVEIVDIIKKTKKEIRLIFISTIGAYDRHPSDNCKKPISKTSIPFPTSEYGKSKLLAEKYIKDNINNYTIIRPTWVYGSDMRNGSHINKFVSMIYEKNIIMKFKFPGKVSLIHVEDLCNAIINCINNDSSKNQEYFAVTQSLSLDIIFQIIYQKIYSKKPKQIPIPRLDAIIGRIHSKLPLTISNLFIDYLYAEDNNFLKLLSQNNIRDFNEHILDVISTNRHNNKYWIITGANSGIGYALASILDSQNEKLILIDKNIDKLKLFKNQQIIKCDLEKKTEIASCINQIQDKNIYCLINNAGIGFRKSFDSIPISEIESTIKINILAPLYLTKFLLPNIIRHNTIIVNIASSVAYNPLPFMSIYSASKAFLVNWTESLMYELKKTNTVISFSPSGTATNFQKTAGVKREADGKGLLSPENVAHKIIIAIKKRKIIAILGLSTNILLITSRIIPRKYNVLLWGKLFEKLR